MRILRPNQELFCYLVFFSCSLLLTFLCIFQDQKLASQRLSINTTEAKLFSTSIHRNNNINRHRDIKKNLEPSLNKNKIIPKIETYDVNAEKFRNDIDYSFHLGDKQVRSLFVSHHSHLLQNSNVDNESLKRDDDIVANHLNGNERFQSIPNQKVVMALVDILGKKLSSANLTCKAYQFKPTCENDFKLANSCDNKKCLQTELPNDLTARIEQLVTSSKLQMSRDDHVILNEMADSISGNYDIILLTAASSNHFLESQALLKNLHENVFPYLKNFTLIFYNLGLTDQERQLMVKYCKCQVKDFPFDKFPPFMTSLRCYSWKPVLIKAHLQKANVLFWMDASVRFYNSSLNLNKFIQTTRERGVQISGAGADSTFRTDRRMYHFFGDEPCAYLSLIQAEATFSSYHHEYFVDRVILEPWVACAINNDCMCLKDKTNYPCGSSNRAAERYHQGKGPIVYGLCHRFDQSAISLILHKVFQEMISWVMVKIHSVLKFRRLDTFFYFPENYTKISEK